MTWRLEWLPAPDELLVLPVEDIAMHLLKRMAEKPQHKWGPQRLTHEDGEVMPSVEDHQKLAVAVVLNEAWDWLFMNGLTVGCPDIHERNLGQRIVSRQGLAVAGDAEPLRLLRAERLLAVPLHPAIERKARLLFGTGEYETAVLMAFRQLEIRVRTSGGYAAKIVGDALMRLAFSPNGGPLTDPSSVPGEQRAVMELYAGAIGAFKNPPSHRIVDYGDPTIAAEQIVFADLLHRMLDGFVAAKAERESKP